MAGLSPFAGAVIGQGDEGTGLSFPTKTIGRVQNKVQKFELAGYRFDSQFFEVPEDFEFGLETWGSVHNLPQTDQTPPKRIAQVFGVFPKEMRWKGRFLGKDAYAKYRAIKAAQQAQQTVSFIAGDNVWDVVIFEFNLIQRSRYDFGFEIMVKPLVDRSGSIPFGTYSQGASTYMAQQGALMKSLLTDQAAADVRSAALVAQSNFLLATILANQPEQRQSISSLLGLSSTVQSTVTQATALVSQLGAVTGLQDSKVYTWATKMLGTVQGYGNTLSTLTGADKSNSIQANAGSDAFTVAATQLGDWKRFSDIMLVNGLTDPVIAVGQTLLIPRT